MKYTIKIDERIEFELETEEEDEQITIGEAYKIIGAWEVIAKPGEHRGSYGGAEEDGLLVLAKADAGGIEMAAWFEVEDERYELNGFPFSGLDYELVPVRPCKECNEETEDVAGEPGYRFRDGTVMCQSCTHNAYRSGWNGEEDEG